MKKNPEFTVTENTTLLPFLLACFSGKSRNHVKGLLKRGQILVDGKASTDFSLELKPGQRVYALLEQSKAEAPPPFPIIYEDEDIIVVDKPAGMLSVATDRESQNTAYHIVTEYMKSKARPGRVFIVHRLDRDTSGVLLLAKNEDAKNILQESWEASAKKRGYTALVEGRVLSAEGRIESWLLQTKTLLVYSSDRPGDGKQAITNYRLIRASDSYSMLEITLETGRKNQIRVHMNDIGHPVVGDKKYGASSNPLGRLGLHASALIIRHPKSGEELQFLSPLPKAFERL